MPHKTVVQVPMPGQALGIIRTAAQVVGLSEHGDADMVRFILSESPLIRATAEHAYGLSVEQLQALLTAPKWTKRKR